MVLCRAVRNGRTLQRTDFTANGSAEEAHPERVDACLSGASERGRYLCPDGEKNVGGMGVIGNDFHDKKELTAYFCAGYSASADFIVRGGGFFFPHIPLFICREARFR